MKKYESETILEFILYFPKTMKTFNIPFNKVKIIIIFVI
jgi:hypothetical protein